MYYQSNPLDEYSKYLADIILTKISVYSITFMYSHILVPSYYFLVSYLACSLVENCSQNLICSLHILNYHFNSIANLFPRISLIHFLRCI